MDPNDLGRLFKQFWGFPGGGINRREPPDMDPDDRQSSVDPFSVLTDPLQMHRFFDQQMDEILKNFSSIGVGRGVDLPQLGAVPDEPDPQSKREFMLKDDAFSTKPRRDIDLDEKEVDTTDFDKLFGRKVDKDGWETVGPSSRTFSEPEYQGIQTWGRSYSSVRRGDGSSETTTTIRNSDGSQTITVTRQIGDQVTEETTQIRPEGETRQMRPELETRPGVNRERDQMLAHPPPADQLYGKLWDKFFGGW